MRVVSVFFCLMLFLLPQAAKAADSYLVTNGSTQIIDEHGVCKEVINNAGGTIMVPTRSAGEWSTGPQNFIDKHPPGVTLAPCVVGCSTTTINWSNCTAASGAMTHGQNKSVTNTASGYSGTRNLSCNNGTISQSGGSCTANSCTLPWGGSIAHGANTTAYQSGSVPCGSSCASQTRTCTNGTLSGSYTNQNCSVASCANCSTTTINWSNCTAASGAMTHGQNKSVTNTASGYTGTRNLSCNNGTISQSGGSCTANGCTLPWGGSIAHGASTTAYQSGSVPCGSSCASQTRTCTNGTLSGSYTNQNCSVASCANCSTTTINWSNCTAASGAMTHGQNKSVTNTASGYTGTRNLSCNNGTISQSGGSCASVACTGPFLTDHTCSWWGASTLVASTTGISENECLTYCTSNGASCCTYFVGWCRAYTGAVATPDMNWLIHHATSCP